LFIQSHIINYTGYQEEIVNFVTAHSTPTGKTTPALTPTITQAPTTPGVMIFLFVCSFI